jgi:hypothetical protein
LKIKHEGRHFDATEELEAGWQTARITLTELDIQDEFIK